MRLWILSDLHMESCRGWDLPAPGERPPFDVMVVAGDLTTRMERGVEWLRSRVTDRPVAYVAGNHEFWGCDIDRTVEKARAAAHGTNIHVLQNDTVVVDDVTLMGATFWTDFALHGDIASGMSRAADIMNDFRRIRKDGYAKRLRPVDTLIRNRQSQAFFADAVAAADADKLVAITHHGPCPEATKAGTEQDVVSAAYVNGNCGDLIGKVDMWIYGHTHETRDFRIGETRVVTNAKGYGPWPPRERSSENPDFDPCRIVVL